MPVRMSNEEIKQKIIQRDRAKKERDALLDGVELPEMSGGFNPLALTGLMGKIGDFKRAFEITKLVEEISDQLAHEFIMRMAENG
jgi:hypothetical protein